MWIQVNKETKLIEEYIEYCITTPITKENCDLFEIDEVPNDWVYTKYENGKFFLDENYKNSQELEKQLNDIRVQREIECFPVINRGALWYDFLTDEQKNELKIWYQAWLDATDTKIIPDKPEWLI